MKIMTFRNQTLFMICMVLSSCGGTKIIQSFRTNQTDVLYAGVEQVIYLNTKSKKTSKVTTNIGTINHVDSNQYLIYPDTLPGKLTLTIWNGKRKEDLLFRIKEVPEIKVSVHSGTKVLNSTIVSQEDFKAFSFLVPEIKNFDLNCVIELVHYQITRIAKEGISTTAFITKPRSGPNEANNLAKKAVAGDSYLFEEIEVQISTLNSDKNRLRSFNVRLSDVVYYVR
ncbi:MAG: hypothetical protein ABI723_22470 [Bacteroidia bacterium]